MGMEALCFVLVSLLPLSQPHIILSKSESINTIGKFTANTRFFKSASAGSFRHFWHSLYFPNLYRCQHLNCSKFLLPSSSFSSFLSSLVSIFILVSISISFISLSSLSFCQILSLKYCFKNSSVHFL